MKTLIFVLVLAFSTNIHAQTVTGTDFAAPTGDYVTLESDTGVNIQGGSVQIQAHGSGTMLLSTEGYNDINLSSDANVMLFPHNGGAVVTVDGIQMQQLSTQPTCGPGTDLLIFPLPGGTGVADQLQICKKADDDTYSWQNLSF
jgi:hypothetical protein